MRAMGKEMETDERGTTTVCMRVEHVPRHSFFYLSPCLSVCVYDLFYSFLCVFAFFFFCVYLAVSFLSVVCLSACLLVHLSILIYLSLDTHTHTHKTISLPSSITFRGTVVARVENSRRKVFGGEGEVTDREEKVTHAWVFGGW